MLFGLGSTDPLTLASTAALLLCAGLAAGIPPARRASSVGPMQALRLE
jgi:ABC-type lipoprotein release transport system permease subunit